MHRSDRLYPKSPEQQIINDAADAMGGTRRILAVKTLVLEGEGTNGNLGQDMTMDASGQRFDVTGYRRLIDLTGGRMRIEQMRTPNFPYFQGQAPQKQVFGVGDRVAYNILPNGNATRASDAVARDRVADMYHHPLVIVRAALDPAAKVANVRNAGNERAVDVTTRDGAVLTLAVDQSTKLPTRVVSMSDNVNLGDVAIETTFDDYQEVGGLKLPARFMTKTDKYTTATLRVVRQRVDSDVGDLTVPCCRRRACRTDAGHRHRRIDRAWCVVPGGPVAPQRARGVCRSSRAHRGASERCADARGNREVA